MLRNRQAIRLLLIMSEMAKIAFIEYLNLGNDGVVLENNAANY